MELVIGGGGKSGRGNGIPPNRDYGGFLRCLSVGGKVSTALRGLTT